MDIGCVNVYVAWSSKNSASQNSGVHELEMPTASGVQPLGYGNTAKTEFCEAEFQFNSSGGCAQMSRYMCKALRRAGAKPRSATR